MHLLVAAHDFYPDPGSGGTGRYVHETTRRLADRGHDVSVLTRRRGDVPARETVAGVRVARYDLSVAGESAPRIAAQLPSAVRTVRDRLDALPDPDLVSFQGPVTGPLLDALADDEIPRSATFHSPWPTEYRIRAAHEDEISAPRRRLNAALRRRVERRALADCDEVFALSRFMAGKLRETYGPVADPTVVPGGVDAERFRPEAGPYAPMADGAGTDDEIAFLTVRRLSPRMGHGMLLEAFARVAADRPRAHLYVAGDGPLREELERRVDALGVAERVTFLGYVPDEDLPSAYAAADCFVLPTTRLEGFGLATLEALASGTPVVATPVGGTTEILSGLDALLWTLDATPRTVAAVTDARGEAVDVNSALAATLERENGDGSTSAITASVGVVGDGTNGEPDESLVIWGTDGHVRYADGGLTVFEDGATYEGEVSGDRDFETLTRHKLSDFVRAVEDGTEPSVPGSFGLRVTALTEAAYEAAETGRTVDVPERIERARTARTADVPADD